MSHEVWQRLGQELITLETRRGDRPLDVRRLAFDLEEHVHRGIPLQAQHCQAEPVDLDAAVDAERDREPQAFEDRHHGRGSRDARLRFGAMSIHAALRGRPLPPEHAVRRRAVARDELTQAQHLVALDERAPLIEPPIDHVAPELERRARTGERGAHGVRIDHPRLDFELVHQRGGVGRGRCGRSTTHARMVSSTAAVSAREGKT